MRKSVRNILKYLETKLCKEVSNDLKRSTMSLEKLRTFQNTKKEVKRNQERCKIIEKI